MFKITHKSIWKIKLLDNEKKWLLALLNESTKKWYELFLFWSRLNWYWSDIDIIIKPVPPLKDIIKLESIFYLYTDTKIDIIPYTKDIKYLITNNI